MQQKKQKLEPRMESVIQIRQPMVRDYSTAGGHHPGDVLIEGDIKTKKWQGYPPENLNVIGIREHPVTKDKIIAGLRRT